MPAIVTDTVVKLDDGFRTQLTGNHWKAVIFLCKMSTIIASAIVYGKISTFRYHTTTPFR